MTYYKEKNKIDTPIKDWQIYVEASTEQVWVCALGGLFYDWFLPFSLSNIFFVLFRPYLNMDWKSSTQCVRFFHVYFPIENVR